MYLYINKAGQVKEIVNDKALRQANDDVNHIYLYCEDLPLASISSGFVRFELPDGTMSEEVFFDTQHKVKTVIPYDRKRDLRYFKDYQKYEFYDIKIPDGEDPEVINVLAQTGLVKATVRFVSLDSQIYALQIIQFYVEESIVKATECINGDQYNYLVSLFQNRYFTDTFTKIKRSPYLYEFIFNIIDYEYGKAWIEDHLISHTGACSTLVKGKTALRAFDFNYDESCSCVVKTPRTNEFYATLGVTSGIPRFDKDLLIKEQYNEEYKALPFMVVEGMNEEGLYVCANLVNREDNITTDTNPGKEKICMNMLPRYLLDRCKNIDEVKSVLANDISIYANTVPELSKYELHFLVRDKNESVVIEFIDNQVKYVDDSILTNFYLYDTVKNPDGKYYTIEEYYNVHAKDPIGVNQLKPYSMGIERYNILRDIMLVSEPDMKTHFVRELDYRRTYKTFDYVSYPFWYSEYVYEGKLDLHTDLGDYDEVADDMAEKFTNRTRDGATWHTEHFSYYNFESMKLIVLDSTEDGMEHVFHLDWETAFDILEKEIRTSSDTVDFYEDPAVGAPITKSVRTKDGVFNFPTQETVITSYSSLDDLPYLNGVKIEDNHDSHYYNIPTLDEIYTKDELYTKDEVYNKAEVYDKTEVYAKAEVYAKDETYDKDHLYTRDELYKKDEVYNKDETYTRTEIETLVATLSAHFLGSHGLATTPASYTFDALCKQYLALHPEITPTKNDYIIIYFADTNTSNFCNYNDLADEFKFMYSFNGDVTGIIARLEDIEDKYEDKNNKVTNIDENSNDTQYPSAKAVYDALHDGASSVIYASCDTVATEQIKEITLQDQSQTLKDGLLIAINYTYSNSVSATADNPVFLKIGSDNYTVRAKWNDTTHATGTYGDCYGSAKGTTVYRVDFTNKILFFLFRNWDNNTTYTPQALGIGYGTCATAAATAAKVVTLASYSLIKNGIVAIKFDNAITVANATLNINSKGAKAIYYHGEKLKAGVIQAGTIVTFIYDGSYYHIIGVDNTVVPNNGSPATAGISTLFINGVNYNVASAGKSDKGDIILTTEYKTQNEIQVAKGGTYWKLLNVSQGVYQWHRTDDAPDYTAYTGYVFTSTSVSDVSAVIDLFGGVAWSLISDDGGVYQFVCDDYTGGLEQVEPAYIGMVISSPKLSTVAQVAAKYGGNWTLLCDDSGMYQYECTAHGSPATSIQSRVGDVVSSTTKTTVVQIAAIYGGTWSLIYDDGGKSPYQFERTA